MYYLIFLYALSHGVLYRNSPCVQGMNKLNLLNQNRLVLHGFGDWRDD